MSAVYFNLAAGDLEQDWSDPSLLTANDDWSNVPSIVGYIGDINTSTTGGLDPRSYTGAALGTVDVNVNQTNPAGFSTGGVTEFALANPTVALAGSGTADAPSLVLYLDGTGRQDIRVRANIRDLETVDDTAQSFNVQYRLSSTGTWTNVEGGYFADVTNNGVVPLDITLPSDANGAATIEVRLMTANADGNDEWIGIDDIVVSSAASGTPTTASVSINDVTVDEDAGTLTFTVTRSDTAGAFTVIYGTSGGSADPSSDYTPTSGQLSFTAGGDATQTITVAITPDMVTEGNETVEVTLSNLVNASGTAEITDATGVGTIRNDDFQIIAIHDVQGAAFFSPILAAEGISTYNTASAASVTVRGVITAVDSFQSSGTIGFYVSEERADWDNNDATSEGIYVRVANAGQLTGLTVGETVTVTAQVMESQAQTNLPRTILVNPTRIIGDNDVADLPTFVMGVDGFTVPTAVTSNDNPDFTDSDGSSGTFDPLQDGIDYFETIEGMRVTFSDAVVADGFVGGSDNFVYFSAYSRAIADENLLNVRGGYTVTGDPIYYPVNTPGVNDDVVTGGRVLTDGAGHPDIIELDFGNFGRGGTSGFDQLLTMGDRLGDVTGILDFDFNAVKLYVTDALDADRVAGLDSTPVQEVTALDGSDARSLRVATFNVENLSPVGTTFSTNNGVEITTEEKFDKLADHIADNLAAPDIIIVEEVQDNNGVGGGGVVEADETWGKLIAELFERTGKTYQYVDEAPIDGDVGGAPGGNIRVGFLYDTGRVSLGDLAADASIEDRRRYTDVIGDGERTTGDLIAVDDTGLGINPADWSGTRRSIVGEFVFNGQKVFAFGSHLPSKGGSGEAISLNQNNDAGAPANGGWADRVKLAEDIWGVQNKVSTTVAQGRVVSGGDFNEFWFYRPLEVLTGYATEGGSARVGGTRYTNLMVDKLTEAERFSYDFDGRSQALDTLLADRALAQVASFDVVHINTGYNERTGAVNPASSDHDPSLASFDMRNFGETLRTAAADEFVDGRLGQDTFVLTGNLAEYTIRSFAGALVVTDTLGRDGTDTLADFELLQFADETVSTRFIVAGTDVADDLRTGAQNSVVFGGEGGDAIRARRGNDTIFGEGGDDRITAADGDDRVSGGEGGDKIDGGSGNDNLAGNAGNDLIAGGSGLDTLRGGDGDDKLEGGEGDDRIDGGVGADRLYGGAGADVFAFADGTSTLEASDRVYDFVAADGDVIDLSAIDADVEAAGDQMFFVVEGGVFTGAAGELLILTGRSGATALYGDVDGDGQADFALSVGVPVPDTALVL